MSFKFLCFSVLLFLAVAVNAQRKGHEIDPQDYQYKHEASGGLRVQTNGVTLYAQYGWIKDIYRTRLLQIDYTYNLSLTDKKLKAKNQNSRDYLFGVQNKFHVIRLSYGFMRNIADKANRNGVRLSFVFFGGFSLGLLKPYYLDFRNNSDVGPQLRHEGYSATNAANFLNNDSIEGASPIRYGLNKIQPVPGLNLRAGLNFDWGTKDAFVKSLEAGVVLDAYYKQLPLLVNNHNRFYQIGFYLSFHLGKRW